jgi:hypothetical protein
MKHLVGCVLAVWLVLLGTGCSEGGKGVNKDRDKPTPSEHAQPPAK